MDSKTLEILIKTRGDVSGIRQSVAAMEELKSKASTLMQNLKMGFLGGVGFNAVGLVAQIPAQINQVISKGVQFNATLESAQLGVAAVMKQFDSAGRFKTFDSALAESTKAIELLKKAAAESPATFEQLVQAYQGTAGAMASSGMTIQQQVQTIVTMSQTLAGLGIRNEQILQETRALLTGNITEDAAAARILGITKAMVEKAKSEGKLFDFLMEKTSAFAEAGKRGATTFNTAMSNVEDVFTQTAAELTKDIFATQREGFLKLSEAMKTNEFRDGLQSILQTGMQFQKWIVGSKVWLAEHGSIISHVVKFLFSMGSAYAAFKAADWIKTIVLGTASLKANAVAISQETAALAANTAAQNANASARGRNIAAAKSPAGVPTAAGNSGRAPYSKEAYDAARKAGMSPVDALANARSAAMDPVADAAKKFAKSWDKFRGWVASEVAAADRVVSQLFSLKGVMASQLAAWSVKYASTNFGNYRAGQIYGGYTDANDMAAAEAMRNDQIKQLGDFRQRVREATTKDEQKSLLAELTRAAADSASKVHDPGFFDAPRDAQNQALKDNAQALSQLARILGQKSDLEFKNVAAEMAAQSSRERLDREAQFDAILSKLGKEQSTERSLNRAVEKGDTKPIEAELEKQKQELAKLRARWTNSEDDAKALDAIEKEIVALEKSRSEAQKKSAEIKKQTDLLDKMLEISRLVESGDQRAAEIARAKLETEREYGELKKGSARQQQQFQELEQIAIRGIDSKAAAAQGQLENEIKIADAQASGKSRVAERMKLEMAIADDIDALRAKGITDETILSKFADQRRRALQESYQIKSDELELDTRMAEARAAGNEDEIKRLEWKKRYNALKAEGYSEDEARRAANAEAATPRDKMTKPGDREENSRRRRGLYESDAMFDQPKPGQSALQKYKDDQGRPVGAVDGKSILPADPSSSVDARGNAVGKKSENPAASAASKLAEEVKKANEETAQQIEKAIKATDNSGTLAAFGALGNAILEANRKMQQQIEALAQKI